MTEYPASDGAHESPAPEPNQPKPASEPTSGPATPADSPALDSAVTPPAPLLAGEGIRRVFAMGETKLEVLRGVDLAIRAGEMLVILGQSGAGKSTLLHILGLLDTPTEGRIFFNGQDLSRLNVERQARVRNESFGFVFQFYHLLPEFTALENVLMPRMIQNGPLGYVSRRNEFLNRAKSLLDEMGLGARLKHRPAQLSGGERQRVAIARALINEPAIVFCDEPTGNLDSTTARSIHEQLRKLNRERGQTFVIVTHNESLAGEGDRAIWMHDGNIYLTRDDYRAAREAARQAPHEAATASTE